MLSLVSVFDSTKDAYFRVSYPKSEVFGQVGKLMVLLFIALEKGVGGLRFG